LNLTAEVPAERNVRAIGAYLLDIPFPSAFFRCWKRPALCALQEVLRPPKFFDIPLHRATPNDPGKTALRALTITRTLRVGFRSLNTLATVIFIIIGTDSVSGSAVSPTARLIPCVRFARIVRHRRSGVRRVDLQFIKVGENAAKNCSSMEVARFDIFKCIEMIYNPIRWPGYLDDMSRSQFEQRL